MRGNSMKLTVKDIKELWNNGQAELVAGAEGLDRPVAFYDMMEQPDIKPWLRKELLLITTGYAIRNDKEAVLTLIRDLNEAGASALAIKTRFFDRFPQEALELADSLHFPLFFLDNGVGFVEAVYPVMVALVEAKSGMEMYTRYQIGQVEKKKLDQKFYFDLTRGDFDREEEAQMRAVSLYWPHLPIRVMEILPSSGSEEVPEKKREKARKKTEEFLMKQNVIYNSISFPKKNLILFQEPGRPGAFEKELETFRENLVRTVKQEYHILVSGRAESYLKVAEADRQLGELRRLTGIPTVEEKTLWWEQMRYEELLLQISRLPEVQSYIEERFRNLVEYDQKHGARLLWTLEELMQNNGSRKETAGKLFLHRNTMAYRVKKIEEILECSLGDSQTVQELAFLCKMREYQNF